MKNEFINNFVDGIFNGTALRYKFIRGGFYTALVVWVVLFLGGLSIPVAGVIALASLDRILGLNLWGKLKSWLKGEGDTNDK